MGFTQFDTDGADDKKIRGGTDETIIGNTGDKLNVSADLITPGKVNLIDSNNSTSTPLAASGVFTGTATDVSLYSTITVLVHSDVDSAIPGICLQFSTDSVNWDESLDFNIIVSESNTRRFVLTAEAQYFRIKYFNGATPQTEFRLQTILKSENAGLPTVRIDEQLVDDRSATVTRAVLTGKSDTQGYLNVGITDEGRVKVDIESTETIPLAVDLPLVTDMTNRLKTANTNRIFSSTWQYTKRPREWSEAITGSATIANGAQTDPAYLKITTSSSSGDSAILATKRFIKYQPFRTHTATFAEVLGEGDANCIQRFGQYTNFNGWGFVRQGTSLKVFLRNNTFIANPNTNETAIEITNWNLDKFDGTGPSGLDFNSNGDLTGADGSFKNALTFVLEFVWHGTQGVKFGIQWFDRVFWGHYQIYSGQEAKPFARTALLPIRYEMTNSAATAGTTAWYIGPNSFNIEDGEDELGYLYSVNTGVTGITVGATATSLLAIRPKATFNGSNNRGYAVPMNFNVYGTNDLLVEALALVTITGGTWTSVGADSIMEYAIGANIGTVSGGYVIQSQHVPGGGNSGSSLAATFEERIFSSLDALNSNNPLCILIQATRLSGTTSGYASIDFREIY